LVPIALAANAKNKALAADLADREETAVEAVKTASLTRLFNSFPSMGKPLGQVRIAGF
jgi:hypothetical protein